nr:MAG TPA: TAR DNA-binding protein [Caudoviricetes sp.]
MNPALLAAILAANTKRQPEPDPEPEPEPPVQEDANGGL